MPTPYWAKRISKELANKQDLAEEEVRKQLVRMYREAGNETIDLLWKAFLDIEKDIEGRNEVYINRYFRTRRYNKILEKVNERLDELGEEQIKITEDCLLAIAAQAEELVDDAIVDNVPTLFLNPDKMDLEAVIHQVWAADNTDYSTRIWRDTTALKQALEEGLRSYAVEGTSAFKVAEVIMKKTDQSLNNAYRIARTEMAHYAISTLVQRYKDYGYQYGIFAAAGEHNSLDSCDTCKMYDGQKMRLEELEALIPVHPSCRCNFYLDTDTDYNQGTAI